MKKLNLFFTLQVLAGLCLASSAQARDKAFGAPFYPHPLQAHTTALSVVGPWANLAQLGMLVLPQPPMTLAAGVNYDVGRRSDALHHADRGSLCSPTYEVELWQVVPKVLMFSSAGRLLRESK